ncbi:hypothetical protein ACQ4LE_009123 [Meloidogyne hapla]|uniref:Uncharacterized protein n=1 Tax=Meloidogyne hapla TaxID=6305 RepID=A0A1I8BBS6_MELHA
MLDAIPEGVEDNSVSQPSEYHPDNSDIGSDSDDFGNNFYGQEKYLGNELRFRGYRDNKGKKYINENKNYFHENNKTPKRYSRYTQQKKKNQNSSSLKNPNYEADSEKEYESEYFSDDSQKDYRAEQLENTFKMNYEKALGIEQNNNLNINLSTPKLIEKSIIIQRAQNMRDNIERKDNKLICKENNFKEKLNYKKNSLSKNDKFYKKENKKNKCCTIM